MGIAFGSWIAGDALESSLGLTGPALVGTVMVTLALVPLAALGAIRATRTHHASAVSPGTDTLCEAHPRHAAF